MRASYGHHFKRTGDNISECDAYVWGSNTNYTLGLGHEQVKTIPDINEFFRKENLKCQQVAISKFHSAFLTQSNDKKTAVYTCGHGRGGRLGHGHNESILTPKMVKSFIEHKVTALSLGIDHSLFLTSSGQVRIVYKLGAYQ